MMDSLEALAAAVRYYRREEGLSQEKLAERLSAAPRTIISIEAGTSNPKMDALYRLFRELHIDANRVFYPELQQSESARSEFTYFLSTCTDDEIRDLFVICKSILSTLRERDSRKIAHNIQPVE